MVVAINHKSYNKSVPIKPNDPLLGLQSPNYVAVSAINDDSCVLTLFLDKYYKASNVAWEFGKPRPGSQEYLANRV